MYITINRWSGQYLLKRKTPEDVREVFQEAIEVLRENILSKE